ncbi:MAG: hydantoinase B/oxoprolinase family protein [Actinomycetota bacterium]
MAGRDLDILERVYPEPVTEEESRCMELLTPAEFEIFSHRMQMIALEANEVLIRTLGSPAGLAGDVGACIYTAQGDPASAAVGIWAHAFGGQLPIKYIIKHWTDDPTVGVRDGDVFFCNEALCGCVHPPDMGTFMPVFYEGRLIAWAEAMAHTTDTGAVDLGGFCMSAESRYEEGMKVTPIKIAEDFQLKNDILTMMENMVRDARVSTLDNKSRFAACMRIRQRLLEVAEKKGPDYVVGGLRKMIEEGSSAARKRVEELNDGIYRQPIFMDMEEAESRGGGQYFIRVMVSIEKRGDRLIADLTGTSPERATSLNCRKHIIHPYGTGVIFCSHLFPDLPPSIGLTDCVELKVPDGNLFNPSEDAAITLGPASAFAANQGCFACMARLLFDSDLRSQLTSTYPYVTLIAVWGGMDRKGNVFASLGLDLNAGGFPARVDKDGVDTGGFHVATRSDCEDAEDIDVLSSMSYLFRRQGADNFGHGKNRGGAGLEYAYLAHKSPMMILGNNGGCGRFASAPGIFGGYAAPPLIGVKLSGSRIVEMMESGDPLTPTSIQELLERGETLGGTMDVESSMLEIGPFNEGDVFATMQGGGAGYGDALERDPASVVKDVTNGLVSDWAARNVYKVAFDRETSLVDEEATARLRSEEREDRKRRGISLEEFEKEWSRKSPPEASLKFYGSWPNCD